MSDTKTSADQYATTEPRTYPAESAPLVVDQVTIDGVDLDVVHFALIEKAPSAMTAQDVPEFGHNDSRFYVIRRGAKLRTLALAFYLNDGPIYSRDGKTRSHYAGSRASAGTCTYATTVDGRDEIGKGATAKDAITSARRAIAKAAERATYAPIAEANIRTFSPDEFAELDADATIEPGDLVAIHSHNRFRLGVACRVTKTGTVNGYAATPTGGYAQGATGKQGSGARLYRKAAPAPAALAVDLVDVEQTDAEVISDVAAAAQVMDTGFIEHVMVARTQHHDADVDTVMREARGLAHAEALELAAADEPLVHLHKPYTGKWTACETPDETAPVTEQLRKATCPRCVFEGDPVDRTRALTVAAAEDEARAMNDEADEAAPPAGFAALMARAERDQAAGAPVVDANGDPVLVFPGVVVEPIYRVFMMGRVPADCGHYMPASEARAGLTTCERCPSDEDDDQDDGERPYVPGNPLADREPAPVLPTQTAYPDDIGPELAELARRGREGGVTLAGVEQLQEQPGQQHQGADTGIPRPRRYDGHDVPYQPLLAGVVWAEILPGPGSTHDRVVAGSRILIDGTEHPIPDRVPVGGVVAPARIIAALDAAGYEPAHVDGYDASFDDTNRRIMVRRKGTVDARLAGVDKPAPDAELQRLDAAALTVRKIIDMVEAYGGARATAATQLATDGPGFSAADRRAQTLLSQIRVELTGLLEVPELDDVVDQDDAVPEIVDHRPGNVSGLLLGKPDNVYWSEGSWVLAGHGTLTTPSQDEVAEALAEAARVIHVNEAAAATASSTAGGDGKLRIVDRWVLHIDGAGEWFVPVFVDMCIECETNGVNCLAHRVRR